jgi:hypothetical protein
LAGAITFRLQSMGTCVGTVEDSLTFGVRLISLEFNSKSIAQHKVATRRSIDANPEMKPIATDSASNPFPQNQKAERCEAGGLP